MDLHAHTLQINNHHFIFVIILVSTHNSLFFLSIDILYDSTQIFLYDMEQILEIFQLHIHNEYDNYLK
jgi:hypothetical protein